ncbi:MAG: hypothetical protein KF901_01935 [Myxococcales bacterium]|nr:hypothetical protein [Myxococcales bacterium]
MTVADGLEAFAPGGAESGRGVTTLRRVSDEFVPLVIAPRLHRYERALPDGHRLVVVSPRALAEPPPADATGVTSIRDLTEVYVLEQLERVASDAARTLAMLREAGCATPIESSFVVALVPSRTELASTAPGLTLVSDRAFQIFPHEAARSFHDRAVRRALFRQALASCPATAALEPPDDRAWSTDLRAALLADLDEVRRQGRAQSARELLGWAGFHPAIDQLLYAPQTAFPDVYFAGIVEPDPFRDDPAYARRPRSKGRRILEMARDALGDERFASFSEALLQRVEPARQALARVAPEMASRLDEWLGAAGTEVNYVLVGVETSSRPEGGYRHRIRIRRDGDPRREPVEVRVRARGGDVSALWDGAGAEGVVEVETEGRLRDVLVDPRGRLAQSDEVARDHPRADDATRHPWRPPVVQSFNLAVGATERVLVGLLDVAMRRQYDTEDTIGLRLSTDPRSTGGLLRWVRGLGAPRDTNVRRGFIAPGIYFDRLHGGFARDDEPGGFRLGAQLAAGWSSLRWFLDPRHGGAAWASLASSLVFRDDGTRSWTLSPSIRANLTRPLGLRGAIVVAAGAAGVIGEPLPGERPGLGGRFLLRGYQNAEVLGRARAFAVVEGRFTPTAFGDLDLNLAHLAWVRELQLAAFVGAGVVFAATDGRDVVAGAEVGVGLRAHFEYGGVQPAVLVFDLAVPLIRGEDARNLPPITTLIAFEQYF